MPLGRAGLPLAALAAAALGCGEPHAIVHEWRAMGSVARADVRATTESAAREILDRLVAGVAEFEVTTTLERPDSPLARVNASAAAEPQRDLDRDLYRCIRLALDYAKATDGLYDPTLGPADTDWRDVVTEREALAVRFRRPGLALDLGGIVRGYALDVGARAFALPGSRGGLLELDDRYFAWGHPSGDEPWSVPLADPRERSRSLGRLLVTDRGIAIASGAGARPGDLVRNVVLALAVADSGADADATATALFVGGVQRAGKFLSEARRIEAVLLVRSEPGPELLLSASLRASFEPSAELGAEVAGRIRYLLPPATLAP